MASYLGRRKFLATLGGAAAWPGERAAAGDAGGRPPDPFRLLPMVVARANVAVGRIRRRLEPAFRWSRSDPAWLVTSN
jgi:hypothetical protein